MRSFRLPTSTAVILSRPSPLALSLPLFITAKTGRCGSTSSPGLERGRAPQTNELANMQIDSANANEVLANVCTLPACDRRQIAFRNLTPRRLVLAIGAGYRVGT